MWHLRPPRRVGLATLHSLTLCPYIFSFSYFFFSFLFVSFLEIDLFSFAHKLLKYFSSCLSCCFMFIEFGKVVISTSTVKSTTIILLSNKKFYYLLKKACLILITRRPLDERKKICKIASK